MIDIHTHIMPGVDDGAKNLDMAIRILEQAASTGTREVILTPHCAPAYGFFNYDGDMLAHVFHKLHREVERRNIPICIHPGMEILFEGRKNFLCHKEEYYPLCGSRYFLIEYFFDVPGEIFLEGIDTVKEVGYEPIVAHPERYHVVQQDCIKNQGELLVEAGNRGALFQINKGSLSGKNGEEARQTAEWLLEQNMVDFVASDTHDLQIRTSRLDYVAAYIKKQYGKERARQIFYENPKCVILDRYLKRD